nr:hypothetical protein [Tanacetum cinerariifolium]
LRIGAGRVPRGPARLRQRGPAAAHRRQAAATPPQRPALQGAQNLLGAGRGLAHRGGPRSAAAGPGNVVAFMHAWRFTHFTDEGGMHSPNPEQLTASHKLWVLLTGVRNPKPQSLLAPSFAVQNITIASPNGPLSAWYARPDTAAPKGTVALFHGYTGSKAHLLHEAGYFRHLGYAVLLVDQTGNGNSSGNRTTIGYREADDVAAAVQYLRAQKHAASP